MPDADLRRRLRTMEAVGSRTVHLAFATEGESASAGHALCGRAVTQACCYPSTELEAGCPGCALEAIALGVDVVRDGDRAFLLLEDVRFEF